MFNARGRLVLQAVLMLALLSVSCGGSGSGAKSAADEDGSKGAAGTAQQGERPILEPASAPSGVLAKMRVRNMAAIADGVMEAASVPLSWRRLLEQNEHMAPFVAAIDWEGSIEGVMAMNVRSPARPHGALSIGVRGVGPVLDLLDSRGIVAVEGPGEVFYFEAGRQDCAVGPAITGSPARVVCSERRGSLDLLIPYALRGLPREELSDADVHMQFEMTPLRQAYGKELKTALRWAPAAARSQHAGHPIFDRALSDGASELAREGSTLIDELHRVTIQVDQKGGSFTGTMDVELHGDSSDVVGILGDLHERQKPAPDLFDGLPSTASAAGYSRQIDEKRAGKWMSIVADLARGSAELEGANRAFGKRLASVIKRLGPAGGTSVFARGPLVSSRIDGQDRLHPAWVLSGSTRPKGEVVGLLDDISWLMASPEMKKLVKQPVQLPQLRRKRMKLRGAPGAAVYEWKLPPQLVVLARAFGAQMGSDVDPDDLVDAVEEIESGLIAVHESGGTTWISWGQTKEELTESFAAIRGDDFEKLGDLGSLGGVRSEPAVTVGFSKLDGLVGMASFLFPSGALDDWSGLKEAMPSHGHIPAVYAFRVEREGDVTTASFRVHVPAEFTQDLAALSVMIAQSRGAGVDK